MVSSGSLLAERDISGLVGGWMPEDVVVVEKSLFFGIPFSRERKEEILHKTLEDEGSHDPLSAESRSIRKDVILSVLSYPFDCRSEGLSCFLNFPNTALYFPLLYMPQATGFALGRALALYHPLTLFYLGRFFNLCAWIFLIWLAIRTAPVFKWVFALLALTPTSLFQAASLSADAFTNGIAFLFIAVTLRHALDAGASNKKGLLYMIPLALTVSLAKFYFLLPWLIFILPEKRFKTRKKYLPFIGVVAALSLAAPPIWSFLIRDLYVPIMPGVSPVEQISFVLGNPLKYAGVLVNTYYVEGGAYLRGFVGGFGHYWGANFPLPLAALHIFLLVFVSRSDGKEDVSIGLKDRAVILAVFFASAVLLSTFLYLSFTKVGGDVIVGLQGRHFVPLAPLLFLLFYTKRKINSLGPWLIIYWTFTLSYSLGSIIRGYYL